MVFIFILWQIILKVISLLDTWAQETMVLTEWMNEWMNV